MDTRDTRKGRLFLSTGPVSGEIKGNTYPTGRKGKRIQIPKDTALAFCKKIGGTYVFKIASGKLEETIIHTKSIGNIRPWENQ